jgi:hypothetical protein
LAKKTSDLQSREEELGGTKKELAEKIAANLQLKRDLGKRHFICFNLYRDKRWLDQSVDQRPCSS